MVTLKDVAAKAGVSPSTASGALRGLDFVKPDTAERVLKAAHHLGYTANVSARALRSGRTGILSLVIPTVDIPFYSMLASAMEICVEREGYQLIIQQTRFDENRERQLLEQASDTLSEGMFLLAAKIDACDVARIAGNHPIVLFEDYSTDIVLDTVNTPSASGTYRAAHHLAERGRTRICIAGGNITRHTADPFNSSRARYDRIGAAITAFDELGITDQCGGIDCDWGIHGGIEAGHKIGEMAPDKRYNGVCCMNDDIALGVLRGLADCGLRVPDDLAVTGFDGVPQGACSVPTLTSVSLDYEGMAHTAVSMMLRKFGDNPVSLPQRVTAGFQLVERESTAIAA